MTCAAIAALCAILAVKPDPASTMLPQPHISDTIARRFSVTVIDGRQLTRVDITEPADCKGDWSYNDITDAKGHPWFTSPELQSLSTEVKRLIVQRYIQDADDCHVKRSAAQRRTPPLILA